jgi:hypothetical protein
MDNLFDAPLKFLKNSEIFYHNSIDDYFARKSPPMKRWLKYWTRSLLLVLHTLRLGVLSLYPNLNEYHLFRDEVIVLGDQARLGYLLFFSLNLVAVCAKFIILYYESRYKLNFVHLLSDYQAQLPFYRFNKEHRQSIKNKVFLLYNCYMRVLGTLVIVITSSLILILAAYVQANFKVDIAIYWLLNSIFIVCVIDCVNLVLAGPFVFYVPITIINYKLDEMVIKLKLDIILRNDKGIFTFLTSYNQLTIIIKQISIVFNMVMGLVYCIVPYSIAITLKMAQIKRDDLVVIAIRVFSYFVFLMTNINAFLINQISASITVRNKTIPSLLYPIFASNQRTNRRLRFKIDSFIARLNKQFIGFYCFNLFKFTKKSFYEYVLIISSCYILVHNFVNNM